MRRILKTKNYRKCFWKSFSYELWSKKRFWLRFASKNYLGQWHIKKLVLGPRACYDEGKRVAETLSYAYQRQENVEVRVARIFNTYGPRMHMNDGRVVSNFVLQALQNHSITIYGDGKQTRSFQYVSDLVEGLVALMNSNYTQPVNIGNPAEHTIEGIWKN